MGVWFLEVAPREQRSEPTGQSARGAQHHEWMSLGHVEDTREVLLT
jgi:hypothetical protein